MDPWTVERFPGGLVLRYNPCQQYRSFHQGEWVGTMMEVMQNHQCPAPAPESSDGPR